MEQQGQLHNEAMIIEIQELKRKISEIKSAIISIENSLILETLDTQLSEKLEIML